MYKALTRLLFTLLVFCFFLPFIPNSCESGKYEANSDTAAVEAPAPLPVDTSETADTSLLVNSPVDTTLKSDSLSVVKNNSTANHNSRLKKILEFIISPDDKNYSTIGYIITAFPWISLSSLLFLITITTLSGWLLSIFNYEKFALSIKRIALVDTLSWLVILLLMHDDGKIGMWAGTIVSSVIFIIQILNRRKTKPSH